MFKFNCDHKMKEKVYGVLCGSFSGQLRGLQQKIIDGQVSTKSKIFQP